jgi:hypothetical protein
MTKTKCERLLNSFRKGQELTSRQIAARFSVANPRDLVYNLRGKGHRINLITTIDSKGRETNKYSLAV